ncbi:hypothetical protein JYB88_02365 [Shewanella cyperi]|uniref:Uncharacterized protein n=1 Tax=Shewanella cyperi TaxID=2814292 RepID=A0A975AL92_9GAMM|nr:DUF4144 family protein [Shewanella cyperi]QSX30526.1 hypothetical protein JYB88_02365 [Shewanella cyperi]
MKSIINDIHWPAIIKLVNSDELLLLESPRDWLEIACLYQHSFQEGDCLADSDGQQYRISAPEAQQDSPVAHLPNLSPQSFPLTPLELLPWVRAHALAAGQCCIAKLGFTTVAQGIELVRSLDS